MNRILYILRAVPGSGKSTLAKTLSNTVFEADMYFSQTGEYKFNPSQLGLAHKWCFNSVEAAMLNDVEKIVVSNTSTRETDVNTYRNLALKHNYIPFVMIVENWHNGTNEHNVPEESLLKMENQLKQTIKLR